jgi:hypothetical protein
MMNTFLLFFSKLNRTSGHVNMPGRCALSALGARKLIVKTDRQTKTEKDTYAKLCDITLIYNNVNVPLMLLYYIL